jgi:hypothetical protein
MGESFFLWGPLLKRLPENHNQCSNNQYIMTADPNHDSTNIVCPCLTVGMTNNSSKTNLQLTAGKRIIRSLNHPIYSLKPS